MKIYNTAQKGSKLIFFIGLLLVGIIFTAIAGYLIFAPNDNVETEATVIDIMSEYDISNESTVYFATVKYSVDGKEYSGKVGCSSSTKVGDTMKIAYDPSNPGVPSNVAGAIKYVFFGIGIVAVLVGLVMTVKTAKKKSEDMNYFDKVDKSNIDPAMVEEIKNNPEPTKEYYFHWRGKLNQSYILETPDRQPICEANCEKITLAKPFIFEFVDHISGRKKTCEVTHTLTSRYGVGDGNFSFSIPNSSSFKIDGENNWVYLGKKGYSVEPHLDGIKLNFDVLHLGVKVAELKAAGANILKDGEGSKLGEALPATGLFKVYCKESDIPMVFMACFCASRVEFF